MAEKIMPPVHQGELLREEFLKPMELGQVDPRGGDAAPGPRAIHHVVVDDCEGV